MSIVLVKFSPGIGDTFHTVKSLYRSAYGILYYELFDGLKIGIDNPAYSIYSYGPNDATQVKTILAEKDRPAHGGRALVNNGIVDTPINKIVTTVKDEDMDKAQALRQLS